MNGEPDKATLGKRPDKDKLEPRRPGGKTKRGVSKRSHAKKAMEKAAKK